MNPPRSTSETATKNRHLSEPLPADLLGQQLCEHFPHRWQPIVAESPSDVTQKPSWRTLTKYPMRPRTLWRMWQDANQLVGVRFGHTTTYALIDLDRGSTYHPQAMPDSLDRLRVALESIGISRSILIRSSWTGGLHLYLPLPTAVSTFGLATALKQTLEDHGFFVRQGQLEIFPNVKRYARKGSFTEYNAHRLPLQPASGSILLNDDLNPLPGKLSTFFSQWNIAAAGQDIETLTQAIASSRASYRSYPTMPTTDMNVWQQDLLRDIAEGWTGASQTNHLLKAIACYGVVFLGLSGEDLVGYVEKTAQCCPGYQTWCRHQHELSRRARDWASACESYYWSMGSPPKRTGDIHNDNNMLTFNRQRAEDAKERIRTAVAQLLSQNAFPDGITARMKAIASTAKCSFSTLRKYPELWHPQEIIPKGMQQPMQEPPQELIQEAVMQHPTSDLADIEPESRQYSEAVKAHSIEALHTPPYMKGLNLTLAVFLSKILLSGLGEGSGRGESSFPQPQSTAPPDERLLIPPQTGSNQDPYDLNGVITGIQVALARLGWTVEQTYQFIADHFHGKRRSQLSDAELAELHHLLVLQLLSSCVRPEVP